ncbi:MAG TPA: YceI family protein [Myxococcota bacterium]|nr:YceI family protein [Myxococcota bacterium]
MLQVWNFEPGHTTAHFRIRHMMVTWVRGSFTNITGTIKWDEDNPKNSRISTVIDVNTLYTGQKDRDHHLLSADFFDAANYPKIEFSSEKFLQQSENDFEVIGDLVMRGVTKPVKLMMHRIGKWATPYWVGNQNKGPVWRTGIVGHTIINRHDFSVSWNDKLDRGGIVASNDAHLTLDIEALLQT